MQVLERERRVYVDYNAVPPSQWKIHDRLENWAKWCNGSEPQECAPGFELHKTDEWDTDYSAETVVPVNREDAIRIQKGVALLPDRHRRALVWLYLRPVKAGDKARELGVSWQGLVDLVHAGRQKLIDRGV